MILPALQSLATPNPVASDSSQAASQAILSQILLTIDAKLSDSEAKTESLRVCIYIPSKACFINTVAGKICR